MVNLTLNPTLEQQLHRHLEHLPPADQRKVLEFAEALAIIKPRPMRKADLLALAGTIPPEDLKLMSEAIEAECEKVDLDGW